MVPSSCLEEELTPLELEEVGTPKAEDAEKELDDVLGKLTVEESPEDGKEKYEYDILYENQRG